MLLTRSNKVLGRASISKGGINGTETDYLGATEKIEEIQKIFRKTLILLKNNILYLQYIRILNIIKV
jgi:hypothetical protein